MSDSGVPPPPGTIVSRRCLPILRSPNGKDGRGFVAVPALERFEGRYFADPNSGCWIWVGSLDGNGYAYFKSEYGKTGHRFAYCHFIGPIPTGKVLDHKCRTRCCVNPWHLEPVTNAENIRRGIVGCNMRCKTHCPHGHPYSEENTKRRNGRRICRICERAYWTKRNHLRRSGVPHG